MKFADILASSIHDIKNSLGVISNRLEELINDPENRIKDLQQTHLLQNEVQRANNSMVQLLTLYKMGSDHFSASIQEVNLDDLLSEIVAENQASATAMGLDIGYQCDPYLCGYFDEDLVRGVLNSTLGNAGRYAKSAIWISAEEADGYLVIRIEDDGNGYPPAMLGTGHEYDQEESFSKGRTHLGLYFADRVAHMHTAGERHGSIRLSNKGGKLCGSCFELRLP